MCAVFLLHMLAGYGQNLELTGRVMDAQHRPLPHAAVSLLRLPDSSAVVQTITNNNGTFDITFRGNGSYTLKIKHLGYKDYYSATLVTPATKHMGDIPLAADITTLATVSITAKRPTVTQQIDRMTIDVGGSVLTEGNSVFELLERTPGVTVEGDGDFAIQGRRGAKVMIDGRATYLSGSQLALLLRGMQAHEVAKVELMASPSARQDAEGSGGIINIVTKNQSPSGIGGDMFTRGSHGREPQYALGGNIHARAGKWVAQLSGSYGRDENRSSAYDERTFFTEQAVGLITRQWEASRTDPGRNYGLRAGIDYTADSTSSVGISFDWIKGRYQSYSDAFLHFLAPDETLQQQNTTQNHFDEGYNNLTFNAHYTKRFRDDGHTLNINVDYAPHGNDYDNGFHTNYHDATGLPSGYPAARRNIQDLANTTYLGTIDYSRPLGANSKLEIGWKGTYLWINNLALNDTLQDGTRWVYDALTSNRFQYGQHVEAAYAIYHTSWKKLGIQMGIRGEYTGTEARQVTLESVVKQHYFDLFPNLFLSYPLSERHQLRLAYSRRIERPGDHDVNAFRIYADPFNYFEGNPFLAPSKTHALELGHSFANKWFTTLSFNRGSDVIMDITGKGEQSGQTFSRPENVGHFTNYGISMMYNSPFTAWWEGSHYANAFHNRYEGSFRGTVLDNASSSWAINSRHTFRYTAWRAELIGYYRSGMASGAVRTAPNYGLDIGVDRSFWNKRANVKLSCTGLVRNAKPESRASFGSMETYSYSRPDNRRVTLSLTYQFGS
ncbi:outer membrane beta-barrel protein [Parapedobacter koreensis]|nr:outer membrane beta-barrel protein [Parapedobacter koreensis]